MATADDSPVAMKLKKMWLKTPVGEEQATQAILDPSIGKFYIIITLMLPLMVTFICFI